MANDPLIKTPIDKNSFDNKIFWSARVIDNKDPMMLNRVRVSFDTPVDGSNNQSILDSIPEKYNGRTTKEIDPNTQKKDLKPEFRWSKIDPFCFLPLIPLFLKITPKINESVNIIWPNPNFKFSEQYYVQGTFSSPFSLYKEDGISSRSFATRSRISDSVQLRNPQNNEYFDSRVNGVFPDYDDISILGRGTCDIIIKEKSILLRSGKSNKTPDNRNKLVVSKENRSFIQLSDFDDRIIDLGTQDTATLEEDISFVNTLIEWEILNPDNTQNIFNIVIRLFKLTNKSEYTTKLITTESNIEQVDKSLILSYQFSQLSFDSAVEKINEFISQVNEGKLNMPPNARFSIDKQHPIVFRPGMFTFKWMTTRSQNNAVESKNVNEFSNKIKFKNTGTNGFGLIFYKNKPGQQFTLRKVKNPKLGRTAQPTTYNIQGGDKLIFISHDSKIPSLKQITLDKNTMYGIDQQYIVQNILTNTNSMVRGEELMKFLNLIVRFLVSHVHAFPGLPPVPVSFDGIQSQDIISRLQNATGTILNENIRIN